jgi:hypothetical protein
MNSGIIFRNCVGFFSIEIPRGKQFCGHHPKGHLLIVQ